LDEKAARLTAGDLLSRHAWTQRELSARLRRRGAPADVAASVVADLTARGYLDDAAFARQWVLTRAPRGYGAARLRAELRQRGVTAQLIDAALALLDGEAAIAEARAVARRRMPAFKRISPDKAGTRLRDHLVRRGYSASVVSRVLRESLGQVIED
jgi:regulatory protein